MFNENEDADEDKITYKESPFKSVIVDIRNELSKNGNKLIKKGLYYVQKIKSLGSAEIKNIKEKLIIFKNELIRKNRINDKIKKYRDNYNSNIKYRGIKNIRYLFNEEDIDNGINNIKYLFNENEDKITHNLILKILDVFNEDQDVDKDNDLDEDKITHKESPFKSIIVDIRNKLSKNGNKLIRNGFYYTEKLESLTSSEIENIKKN